MWTNPNFRDVVTSILSYVPSASLASMAAANKHFSKLCVAVLQKRFTDLAEPLKRLYDIEFTLHDAGRDTPEAKGALLLAIKRDDSEAIRLLNRLDLVDLTETVHLRGYKTGSLGDLASEESKYCALEALVTLGVTYDRAEEHRTTTMWWVTNTYFPLLQDENKRVVKMIDDLIVLRDGIRRQKTAVSDSRRVIA